MLALSVSIPTISSPRRTSSPSDFSHLTIVPSSIESERRGIATSAMGRSGPSAPEPAARLQVAERRQHPPHDLRLLRGRELPQRPGVRHGDIPAPPPPPPRAPPTE